MNEEKKIRILVVDDHAVVRSGLRAFLVAYEDFEMVGEARNGEAAVRMCETLQPDVVLMDLVMPGMNGADATRMIRKNCPKIQIIALTSFKEQDLVQGALQAGAIGYLLKDVAAEELATAIRLARTGKPSLSPEAAQVLIESTRGGNDPAGAKLTEREREVLTCMVDGMSNQEIGEKLFISIATVKSHVSSILSKLGVQSRIEAVSFALKNRL